MNRSIRLIIVGLLALALGIAAYLAFLAPQPAPQVTFVTLTGQRFSTADLRGKVVLVNFWATSCVTCVKEMPRITATYDKYKDRGFDTIAVAMSYDPPNYVLKYAEVNRLPFKVALDTNGTLARNFGDVRLTPTTFILDKRGNVVARYLGEPDFAALDRLLEQKLAERG